MIRSLIIALAMLVTGNTVLHAAPAQPRNVAILVFEGVELLDFAGPTEAFAVARFDGERAFNVYTVSPTTQPIKAQGFVTVVPQYSIDNCPPPAILVIPGGEIGDVENDARVKDWIRRTVPQTEVTMSVCNGAFVLATNGLLDGLEATTHYSGLAAMRTEHPSVRVRDDVRVVDNGKIVTTAGISAGIDGALHLVNRLCGEESAWMAARNMEYRWEPPALPSSATEAQKLAREGLGDRIFARWAPAAELYERLTKLQPDNADAYAKLALCQLRLSHDEDAIANATRARELGFNDRSLLTTLARAQLGAKKYDQAIASYNDAIAAGADGPTNYYNLACSYALIGQKDKSLEALQKSLERGPWMKKQAASDDDFVSIREDQRFKALVAAP